MLLVWMGFFYKDNTWWTVIVAINDNENMGPIALAVMQVENTENWTWFLRELLEDIIGLGDGRWTFIKT